jgi:hypothetical protein
MALSDQRIALGPIVSAPGEHPRATGASANDQPVAVVFDLVNPLGADRGLGRKRRDAGIDKALRAATSRRTTQEHSGNLGCDAPKRKGQATDPTSAAD